MRILALALLVGASLYGVKLYQIATIGSGYFAKMLCSGVFVGGQPTQTVIQEDVLADMAPILQRFDGTVDRSAKQVRASLFGFASQQALYRPKLGCTLAIGKSIDDLKTQATGVTIPDAPSRPSALWPAGEVVDLSVPDPDIDGPRLKAVVDAAFDEPDKQRMRRTRAVVVVHKGRIVAERYAPDVTPATPLLGWSMTKTAVNALTGILVARGKISVESKALLPQWTGEGDARAEISLDNLLRMSSGLAFNEEYDNGVSDVRAMLFRQESQGGFAASKHLKTPPGTRWKYSSGTTNIVMKVLERAYGKPRSDFLAFPHKALFAPLGMSSAVMEPDASGSLVGSSYLYASARDWARLGLFFLQDGVWNGNRILPEGWVSYARTPSKNADDYGAHVWLKLSAKQMGPKPLDPLIPQDAFFMLGHDGQVTAVIPSYDLVVVRLGISRQKGAWRHGPFLSDILAAFKPGA